MVCCGLSVWAGHLIGGELTYRCLGNNDYEINLTIYRNCLCEVGTPSCAEFDPNAKITIYNNNLAIDTLLLNLDLESERQSLSINNIDSLCTIPEVCVEQSTGYVGTVNLPPSEDGYTLSYMRCCRDLTVLNIKDPQLVGSTFVATIPGDDVAECNNSPTFDAPPPLLFLAGDTMMYNYSASDVDGDSLVYELCTPFDYPLSPDNNIYGPAIRPGDFGPNPPYDEIPWEANFSEATPLGNESSIEIDAFTGLLKVFATTRGQFNVAICVSEYRNGQFLNLSLIHI